MENEETKKESTETVEEIKTEEKESTKVVEEKVSIEIICPGCGYKLNESNKFCPNCGTSLKETTQKEENQKAEETEQEKKAAMKLGIIALALFFGGSALSPLLDYILPGDDRTIISAITSILPLAGIVVMIVGRVNYSKNTFLKVVMWIMIGMIISSIILFILFFLWCYITCSTMDTSGCG